MMVQQGLLPEKGLTNEKKKTKKKKHAHTLELALFIESGEKYTQVMKIANGKPFPVRDMNQFDTQPRL